MDARDRVFAVLNHEIPDFVPVLFRAMDQNLQYHFIDKFGNDPADEVFFWRDLTPLLALKLDAFDIGISPKRRMMALKDGKRVDIWGRIREKGAYVDGFFKNGDNFDRWPEYEIASSQDPQNLKTLNDLVDGRIALFASLPGFFEYVWESMSMGYFCKSQRSNLDLIRKIADKIERYTIRTAKQLVEAGIEFFSITDDLGYKGGLITRLSFFEEQVFPRYERIINIVHKQGGKIYLHSEGNIFDAIPGIINSGFDGVQGLSVLDGIDIQEVKEKYGEKIALLGGFTHHPMLADESFKGISAAIDDMFQKAGGGGGLMMGPSAAVDRHCDIDRVKFFIERVHNCRYF